MKLVVVEEFHAPEIVDVIGDQFIIEDTRYWLNLDVNDMLQLITVEFGTECYRVIDIQPAPLCSYPRGVNLVTIRLLP